MAENRRVLIVDQQVKAGADTSRVLRTAGYDVLEAATGKEGLQLARERQPHLILVDEALPDISGIDLVKEIRRDAGLSGVYIAVLGRDGTAPGIQARALESGADALIQRTSQTRELLARTAALLRRQGAEESLRTSLQDFRATFDAMSDAVYLVNMDYIITDCNLAMARFLAKPRGEIVGGRCFELVHGAKKPIPACLGHRVRETRRRETLVVPVDDRWLQVGVDPLLNASNAVIGSVHILRDITDQRRNEDALQQARAELDRSAAEHHLTLDKASKDLQAEVDARVHTQDVLKRTQSALELRGRELEEVTAARRSAEENLERAQQELLAAADERRAQQVQKMDALRRLAAGVANEFNRLLATIVGQIELLLARVDRSNPLHDELQAIAKVAKQGVALIRQLLAFAGREAVQPEVLDVNAALQKLKPKLRRTLGSGVELQLALAPQLKPVYADARVLQDIWLNLAARAAVEMPQGGVLHVETSGATLAAPDVRIRPMARAGEYVRVTLTHGGAELPAEALQGIFELQLASPEAGVGSELGLGVVYGLVHQLGGFVEVAQTAAGQTEWAVHLPAHAAEGAVEEPEQVSAEAAEAGAVAEQPAAPQPAATEAGPAPAGTVGVEAPEPAVTSPAADAGPVPPPPEPASVAAQPAPAEVVSAEAAGRELTSPAAEADAIPPPAADASTAPMPQQDAVPAEQPLREAATETPQQQEAIAGPPQPGSPAPAGAPRQVPVWLVEEPASDDITESAGEPAEAPGTAPGDITEAGSQSPPPSGLRSRLRRLRNRS